MEIVNGAGRDGIWGKVGSMFRKLVKIKAKLSQNIPPGSEVAKH